MKTEKETPTDVWLTRGMFGEKLEKIAENCGSFGDAMFRIEKWKKAHKGGEYKIETYDRIICGKEKGTAVDFGDYSYFMLILPVENGQV